MSLNIVFNRAFVLSLAMVGLCRKLALRFGFIATPSANRWHDRPVALLGGVTVNDAPIFAKPFNRAQVALAFRELAPIVR